jgi:hypothetical protein
MLPISAFTAASLPGVRNTRVLDGIDVDRVILFVRPDESDVDDSRECLRWVEDMSYQAITITADIKNDSAAGSYARRNELAPEIRW